MIKQKQKSRAVAQILEGRRLLSSTGTLLQYDFNSASPWPAMTGTSSAGGAAALIWGGVGTIDTEAGTTPTGALRLTETPPTSGDWVSAINSGTIAVANTETNLGKLTLSFNLSATQTDPVTVRIFSYLTAGGAPTGGLQLLIYPASTYYNQRFAVDLSTMTPYGAGTFNPTAPYVSFSFEMNSQNGWNATNATQLRLDNVNYSKPAYYVNAATGKDTFSGLTESTAFATPAKAVSVSQAGDIILVMSGTYSVTNGGTNKIVFKTAGTPADWITLKNYPGQSPVIQSEWWDAIHIGNGSSTNIATTPALAYLEVRGLHILGDANYAATTYNTSIGQPVPQTNGNGLSIDGRYETNHPHDIRFADNLVEYCSGGGIGAGECDRVQIENNISRYNCWWTIYAPSGISVLSAYNFDGTSGYVTRLVRNNLTYGNQCFDIWASANKYSDGNGIIIDVNHNTSSLPNGVAVGRTLVTNNVSYDNGGSGIHAFSSSHVDIINNTAYLNSAQPHLQYGEIFASGTTSDDRIYNNILVAPIAAAGQPAEPVNSGTVSYFQNNIYFGGNTAPVMGAGDRILDPQFISPTIDPATANFRLRSTSPAINMGGTNAAPYLDYDGNVRTGLPDIGAFEYTGIAIPISTAANAVPRENTTTTTKLNIVTGTDLGPAPYTYSWATTAKPSGSSNPTISPSSGSGLATISTATFTSAGAYTFTVTVTDANAVATTYPVSMTVFQASTTISVAPNPKTLITGASQQFTATDADQFGQPMVRTMAWATNSSGGTISSTGLFTASQLGGTYSVSATTNLVFGYATVNVVPISYTNSSAGYYIRLASDAVTEQIWVGAVGSVGPAFNATPSYSILLSSLPSLSFGPAIGAERLIIDLSNGKPLPTGGLSFDGGSGADSISILGSAGNDSITVNATQILFGTTPITYANTESISVNLGVGVDTLTQTAQPGNAASLTWVTPTASDSLIVTGGTFTVPAAASGITRVSLGNLNISSGAKVVLTAATLHTTRNVLAIGTLMLPTNATLDLGGNDLIVSTTSSDLIADILSGLYSGGTLWSGTGLTTSAPAGNLLRMISLTVATTGQSFDSQSPNAGDLLIKTTYFGDATLDGKVDGSDYSRIDSGYLTLGVGWDNGDFNYDGVVNGSDYTLIDNAFNNQGGSLAAEVALPVNRSVKIASKAAVAFEAAASDQTKHRKQSVAEDLEQLTVL